jgi:hypothetical protein
MGQEQKLNDLIHAHTGRFIGGFAGFFIKQD